MKNLNVTSWQLPLSVSATPGCAVSALATLEVQGIAVRPIAAFAAFAGVVADVATDLTAVKRDRAGMDHARIAAVYVPGSLAWSPPI